MIGALLHLPFDDHDVQYVFALELVLMFPVLSILSSLMHR